MNTTTDVTLADLLGDFEAVRGDERPEGLTASGLHPVCERQAAYELQGVEPTDDTPRVTAATVGTMIHEAYTRLWAARDPSAVIERRGPHGQPDVIRAGEVRDLKTVNGRKFDEWRTTDGPPDEVWDQLAIYGHDAGLPTGARLVIDALCRETGRTATYEAPFTRPWGEEVVAELGMTAARLLTTPIAEVSTGARTGRGDWFCDRCPFRTDCLGNNDEPEDAYRGGDAEAVAAAARAWMEASLVERGAKEQKAAAKRVLVGVKGTFGEYEVSWTERSMPERVLPPGIQAYPRVGWARP